MCRVGRLSPPAFRVSQLAWLKVSPGNTDKSIAFVLKSNFHVFLLFTKVGLFTIGGGYAVIPLIEKELVSKSLLERKDFYTYISITESLPGVFATNLAALIGFKLDGVRGGIAAALGTIIAPFVIIIVLANFYGILQENPYWIKIFKAIRPAVVALILSPCLSIIQRGGFTLKSALLPVLALICMIFLKVSPVWIVLAGCIGGLLYSVKKVL